MTEIIADVETTVVSPDGHEYYVQVGGERLATGLWEAWLEFVPLDGSLDVLLTTTETTQPTRDAVVRWSETVTPVYLQGALARAVAATDRRRLTRNYPVAASAVTAPFDPFAVFPSGKEALRARLRVRSRSELLAIVEQYGLNPAAKRLTWLSDSQLVTFIVTAVEVQALSRKR
jgi:hypothetical protein